MSSYRLEWSDGSKQLSQGGEGAKTRHESTKKRILMRELLTSLNYEDMDVLKILEEGSTLAGEVDRTVVFEESYKPSLTTLQQLGADACERNKLILGMTTFSGDETLDKAVLQETMDEVSRGWADGPWRMDQLEADATISRRFALVQGEKTRMMTIRSLE